VKVNEMPTIKEVLANKDQFPAVLVDEAQNLANEKTAYAKFAADAASKALLAADETSLGADDLKTAIGAIIDQKQAVNDGADKAFAVLSKNYSLTPPPPANDNPPPPPPPAPDIPVGA
jgi:hypothetical protein